MDNDNVTQIVGYHTQENRLQKLTKPQLCKGTMAWLGTAYYFWEDIENAHKWGVDSKNNNYEIYNAYIDMSNIIDAEYNREGRKFFYECLDSIKEQCNIERKTYNTVVINKLLKQKFWDKMGITGIVAADTPSSKLNRSAVPVFHKRRVQIAVFKLSAISNFQLIKE